MGWWGEAMWVLHNEAEPACSHRGGATGKEKGVKFCVGLDLVQRALDSFRQTGDLAKRANVSESVRVKEWRDVRCNIFPLEVFWGGVIVILLHRVPRITMQLTLVFEAGLDVLVNFS